MLQHILVPTDGSECSLKAASYACALAQALGSNVSLLVVQSNELIFSHSWGADIATGTSYGAMSVDQVRELLTERVRTQELPAALKTFEGLAEPPACEIRWGDAADEICGYAEEKGVDLIVLGSHGRKGMKRLVLGSVSERVAARAPCSVMVVR